ncbi:DUF1990 domain-containing protein [soil metagenome]
MLLRRQPTPAQVHAFLTAQTPLRYTYPGVGTTATVPPAGYTLDRTRILLGSGEPTFQAARHVIETWGHFDLGWVQAVPADVPVREGAMVGVLVRANGAWWLNSARIVYVFDEAEPIRRAGFAYGTLPGHAECGEERFCIEWNRTDDSVWYEILAFSRPRHLLARMGYPLVRRLQKRFARDSCAAVLRKVQAGESLATSRGA